ncbi:hypothetical protein [Photobacterium lutimaris]|uniref:Uncharacterized protein n=1 Tax=Photobacterium lutimaris TaxID=388278 RepID=A0A2T3ITI7_9GAMM|nr:hypothetical protein [Photobacterium lutimaris]PSU31679.1 hypothetical protein C9I99_21055 [Photobacterium lutimaris]TDR72684.1 hypothetical protein DFP78_113160 [Photobacterium lutimaris]
MPSVSLVIETVQQLIRQQMYIEMLMALLVAIACVYASIRLASYLGFRLIRLFLPYPVTQYGFRGKLLYADDSLERRTFFNKEFGVSAKPDLVYRLNSGATCVLEIKSRHKVIESDVAQLAVGIVAVRTRYPATKGAIVLGNGKVYWQRKAGWSSSKIMRHYKRSVTLARKIKARPKNSKIPCKPLAECRQQKCPYIGKCH